MSKSNDKTKEREEARRLKLEEKYGDADWKEAAEQVGDEGFYERWLEVSHDAAVEETCATICFIAGLVLSFVDIFVSPNTYLCYMLYIIGAIYFALWQSSRVTQLTMLGQILSDYNIFRMEQKLKVAIKQLNGGRNETQR